MPQLLLLISVVLAVWGILGLVEYFVPGLAIGLQNRNFPAGLQFVHFLALVLTGAIFATGYLARWPGTTFATVTMYAVLSTICFIETVDFNAFGNGPWRFVPMAIEYVVYVALSAYLLRSPTMRQHFRPGSA